MFCSNCGNQVEEGSKFCTFCGAAQEPVDQSTPVQPVAEEPVQTVQAADPSAPVQPEQAADPYASAQPVQPADSYAPVQPVQPADPYAPVQPADPYAPVQPIQQVDGAPTQGEWGPLMQGDKKKSKTPLILAVVGGSLLLVVIVLIIVLFACKDNDKDGKEDKTKKPDSTTEETTTAPEELTTPETLEFSEDEVKRYAEELFKNYFKASTELDYSYFEKVMLPAVYEKYFEEYESYDIEDALVYANEIDNTFGLITGAEFTTDGIFYDQGESFVDYINERYDLTGNIVEAIFNVGGELTLKSKDRTATFEYIIEIAYYGGKWYIENISIFEGTYNNYPYTFTGNGTDEFAQCWGDEEELTTSAESPTIPAESVDLSTYEDLVNTGYDTPDDLVKAAVKSYLEFDTETIRKCTHPTVMALYDYLYAEYGYYDDEDEEIEDILAECDILAIVKYKGVVYDLENYSLSDLEEYNDAIAVFNGTPCEEGKLASGTIHYNDGTTDVVVGFEIDVAKVNGKWYLAAFTVDYPIN